MAVTLVAGAASVQAAEDPQPIRINVNVVTEQATDRPAALVPMYLGLVSLQAFDGYSTLKAVRNGAVEQNPLVGWASNQSAAMWTLKAASTASTIYFAERLWRDHKKTQAIVTLVVANATMAAVAAHNASVLRAR
ncbi:MAG TPA: DUF5658 family protein [Vicinamibacterales bacterium]|nr:DUF5658 family protein [Vicinamibacterales bacterium]